MGHDIVEVLGRHKAIIVQVSFHKHLIQFLIRHILAQIVGYSLQISNCDLSTSGSVKRCKNFVNFCPAVFFT